MTRAPSVFQRCAYHGLRRDKAIVVLYREGRPQQFRLAQARIGLQTPGA